MLLKECCKQGKFAFLNGGGETCGKQCYEHTEFGKNEIAA
jgi:hypothetical protein